MDHKLTMSDSLYRRANLLIHQRKRISKILCKRLNMRPYSQDAVDRIRTRQRILTFRQAILLEILLEGME